jgi:hypothetical protein
METGGLHWISRNPDIPGLLVTNAEVGNTPTSSPAKKAGSFAPNGSFGTDASDL